jgi:hypothetical protein
LFAHATLIRALKRSISNNYQTKRLIFIHEVSTVVNALRFVKWRKKTSMFYNYRSKINNSNVRLLAVAYCSLLVSIIPGGRAGCFLS